MGTNYYFHPTPCPTCGHSETRHIGKKSYGWVFALHVESNAGIQSLADWETLWASTPGEIRDEYGEPVTVEEMRAVIRDRLNKAPPPTARWLESNNAELGPGGFARSRIDGRRCIGHGEGPWSLIVGEFS